LLRFLVWFLVLLIALFTLEMLAPVQHAVILPWTALLADLSGWLMRLFDSEVAVTGKVIRSTTSGFGVSIEPGCNGVEAMIVLLAAITAFPATWGYKLKGLLAGFLAIQGLNLVRIISLYLAGADHARCPDRVPGVGAVHSRPGHRGDGPCQLADP